MLISTVNSFLDTQRKATKSGDLFPKFIGEKGNYGEKYFSVVPFVAMATQFSTQCLVKLCFLAFNQILTKYFKRLVFPSLEVNLGIFFRT